MKEIPIRLKSLMLAGLMAIATSVAAAPVGAAQTMSSETAMVVVNLNTATEAELTTLPGIGPSRAQAIVQQRERRPFRRVEDLLRVRGIDRATFRRLRPLLSVQ